MIALLGLALACTQTASTPAVSRSKPVPLPVCSRQAQGEWRFVREQQLGIEARGRGGTGWVGMTAATDGFHDWAPLDDWKTTICGQLATFRTFEPTRQNPLLRFLPEIPERDWNIILVPAPKTVFDERFKLATRLMERGTEGDLLRCFGDTECFEAEITPRAALLKANVDEQWLSACRVGQTMCVFGPWVGDGGHGFRPEIHPAERIWWRHGDRIRLLFVQDASQRFGDRRSFQWKWGQSEPDFWHPWAMPGLQGEFRIAFEARRGTTVRFAIEQMLDENTRTLDVRRRTAGSRLEFPLERAGTEEKVEVALRLGSRTERLELDFAKLDVDLADVCDRGDGTLQGYLHIGDKVGYRYQEGEGFDAFEVTRPPFLTPEPPEPAGGATVGEQADGSLSASVRVTASEKDTQSHKEASVPLLGSLLSAAVLLARPSEALAAAPSQEAVDRMAAAKTDLVVAFAQRFELKARPHYDGPRAERMEAAIAGADLGKLRRLLNAVGASVPDRVEWKVTLEDFATSSPYSGPYTLKCSDRMLKQEQCVLELPASLGSNRVLGVQAKASLMAGNSVLAHQEVQLASHFIRASKSDSAEKVFGWLGSGHPDAERLRVLSHSQNESWPDLHDLAEYRRGYYARMLRHGVALATSDGRITLDELRQFADLAQAFSALDSRPLDRTLRAPTAK